jgi:hypothetical protein
MENPRRHDRTILSGQVIFNLFLAWMLLSTFNIVFLLPFPYNVRVPDFLMIAALGLTAASISGILYLYRRRKRLAILGILKTPPVLVWCFASLSLAVVLGFCIRAYPEQWTRY